MNYAKSIKDLLASPPIDADKPLPSLTTAKLQAWLGALTARGLAAGTLKVYCDPIRAAVTRAWKRGQLTADVAADLELPRKVAAQKDAFTRAQIDLLLGCADPEWRVAILASSYAGLRLGDATSLTWRQVDLVEGVLRLEQGKTKTEVVIPLHPRLRSEIEKNVDGLPDAALCPSLKGQDSRGTHGLSGQFKRIMKKAGITSEERGHGQRKVSSLSAHSLRHFFIRRLLSEGGDETVRMRLSGHASKAAHRQYSKPELALLRAAVDRL